MSYILAISLALSLLTHAVAQQRGAELLRQPALVTAPPALPQPIILPPAPATNSVTLTWVPSVDPDHNVAGYNVYYGVASRVYTNKLDAGAVTNLTVRDLGEGPYFFTATAYNILGVESDYSNEAIWPEPPLTNVIISVSAQSASAPSGPWLDVPGSNFFTATNPPGQKFWRLKITSTRF